MNNLANDNLTAGWRGLQKIIFNVSESHFYDFQFYVACSFMVFKINYPSVEVFFSDRNKDFDFL